jgi:hypothetical protein
MAARSIHGSFPGADFESCTRSMVVGWTGSRDCQVKVKRLRARRDHAAAGVMLIGRGNDRFASVASGVVQRGLQYAVSQRVEFVFARPAGIGDSEDCI